MWITSSVALHKVRIQIIHPPSSRIKLFLERIANDVLSLSRIQLQVLTIQQIEFDVIEEVNQLAGVFKNELKM